MIAAIICVVVAVFAIVILYLTRGNIIDLLDRDVVMYDKNYQLKKECIEEAFNCLDLVSQNGTEIKNNAQFISRAKEAYNGLLCTVTVAKIYQEFYRMAIDVNSFGYSVEDIEKFKILCRAELVSKRKSKGDGFKGTASGALNGFNQASTSYTQPRTQQRPAPVRPQTPAQRPQVKPQTKPADED